MSNQEIKGLTGIRGLAAIYVIIFHWNAELAKLHLSSINPYLKTFMGHGYLSVDLFFVMSGFVLCLSGYKLFYQLRFADYIGFMKKRFFRLFPLYIAVTILFFIFFKYKWITFWINLTLLQGLSFKYNNSIISPGWSLTNEWVIYFIFPLLLFFIIRYIKKLWVLVVIALLILIFISLYRSLPFNWSNYNFLRKIEGFHPVIAFTRGPASFLRTLADYLLGIFAFHLYQKGHYSKYYVYIVLISFIALFFPKVDILVIMLMPLIMIYLCHDNHLTRFLSSKIIYFLGMISYSLYLNHYLFIKSYRNFNQWIGFNNNLISLAYVLLGTIILSIITYYLLENIGIKYLRWRASLKHN